MIDGIPLKAGQIYTDGRWQRTIRKIEPWSDGNILVFYITKAGEEKFCSIAKFRNWIEQNSKKLKR